MNLKKKKGICCFLDVYGYSAEAEKRKAILATNKLLTLWGELTEYLNDYTTNIDYSIMSDSIFIGFEVGAENSYEVYYKYIEDTIKYIIKKAAENDFLLRGAAAFGDYIIGNNIIGGDSAIRANKYEKIVSMPVFFIPYSELSLMQKDSGLKRLRVNASHRIETKDMGVMYVSIILSNELDDYERLLQKKIDASINENKYTVTKALLEVCNVVRKEREDRKKREEY